MTLSILLFLLGRILLGGYFIMSGYGHLKNSKMLSGYAKSKGVKMAEASVLLTGFIMILGGLGVLSGFYMNMGLWLILIFLVPTTLMMHKYWKETDPMAKMSERINFMKNMGLAGAVLILISMM